MINIFGIVQVALKLPFLPPRSTWVLKPPLFSPTPSTCLSRPRREFLLSGLSLRPSPPPCRSFGCFPLPSSLYLVLPALPTSSMTHPSPPNDHSILGLDDLFLYFIFWWYFQLLFSEAASHRESPPPLVVFPEGKLPDFFYGSCLGDHFPSTLLFWRL